MGLFPGPDPHEKRLEEGPRSMSVYQFKLPDIGEGIAEAEIVAWHVKVGDRIEEDQQLADMMTDKATVEMESPVAGTVVELAGEVGDQVAIGAALVVIETDSKTQALAAEKTVESGVPAKAGTQVSNVQPDPGVSEAGDSLTLLPQEHGGA